MNSFKTSNYVILQHVLYQLFYIRMVVMTQRLYDILLCMDWDYASSLIFFGTYVLCMSSQL